MLKLIPGKFLINRIKKQIKKISTPEGEHFLILWEGDLLNKKCRKLYINEKVNLIKFEDQKFYIFDDIKKILVFTYGDNYMTPIK